MIHQVAPDLVGSVAIPRGARSERDISNNFGLSIPLAATTNARPPDVVPGPIRIR